MFIKNSYRDKLDALEINYYESVAKMNEIINLHRPFFAHAISVKELLEIYSCDTEYIAKVRLGY